jgi:predicted nucleic acid-binding protein
VIVLDCSFALAMVMPDQRRPSAADQVASGPVLVPALWAFEVANAFRSAVRRGRVTDAEVIGMCTHIEALRVSVAHPDEYSVRRSYLAASSRALTPYDACYVDLALQRGARLATLDAALARAAREAGVTVLA